MKQCIVCSDKNDLDGMVFVDAPVRQVVENDVLIKLRSAALNYRDITIPMGKFVFAYKLPHKWKKGDRVITPFNQSHQFGPISPAIAATGLGGTIDGALRQYGVFNDDGVVRAPSNISFAEARTFTGAPLTSWNALYGFRPLKVGETVLVQGTGGVSISALQKAEKLKALGADHVINHKDNPEWGPTTRKSTHDESGVDHILEIGGFGTLAQSLKAIKYQGVMSLIGFLGANSGEAPPSALETLSSIIHPAVDSKSFSLEQAKEAFEYLGALKHIGKACVQIK
ncbi:chaperonin 10-like protein [Fusarium oxysporum]|nr:chaperonin 10-like protein [Fusarium oxysporum]